MFICKPCLEASSIKTLALSRSYGPCEMCRLPALCHDIHPELAPREEVQDRTEADA